MMKTKHCFFFALITFLTIAGLVVSATAAPAPPKPKPLSCSLIGTWSGWADRDWSNQPSLAWTAVQTAGTSPTNGGIVTSWVPSPRDIFGGSHMRMTDGHGVWQGSGSQFNYTWYAYLVGDDPTDPTTYGQTVMSIRTYGLVTFQTDCNNAGITYTLDTFKGMVAPEKMTTSDPSIYLDSTSGIHAGETRAPLVLPTI